MKHYQTVQELNVTALVKGDRFYQWGTVLKPLKATSRGKVFHFAAGDEVGVLLSSDARSYRFVARKLPISQVFTFPADAKTKNFLTKKVKWKAISNTKRPETVKRKDIEKTFQKNFALTPIPFNHNIKAFAAAIAPSMVKLFDAKGGLTKKGAYNILMPRTWNAGEDPVYTDNRFIQMWYNGESSVSEMRKMVAFCRQTFKATGGGTVPMYRGTKLKEDLEVGYAFKLETNRSHPIQSWSRDVTIAMGFQNGGYVLRAHIPTKLILITDEFWTFVKADLFKPESAITEELVDHVVRSSGVEPGFLDTPLRAIATSEEIADTNKLYRFDEMLSAFKPTSNSTIRELFAWRIRAVVRGLIDGPLGYTLEHEAIVDFSSGFRPLCEVLLHAKS